MSKSKSWKTFCSFIKEMKSLLSNKKSKMSAEIINEIERKRTWKKRRWKKKRKENRKKSKEKEGKI